MPAILAKQLGMTQRFQEDGRLERVTVLEAGPCPVTAIRTNDADGYEAVQLGFGTVREKALTRAELGPREVLLLGLPEGELHRLVAVAVEGADRGHGARARLEDGDALDAPVLLEELGHADLLGEDGGHGD